MRPLPLLIALALALGALLVWFLTQTGGGNASEPAIAPRAESQAPVEVPLEGSLRPAAQEAAPAPSSAETPAATAAPAPESSARREAAGRRLLHGRLVAPGGGAPAEPVDVVAYAHGSGSRGALFQALGGQPASDFQRSRLGSAFQLEAPFEPIVPAPLAQTRAEEDGSFLLDLGSALSEGGRLDLWAQGETLLTLRGVTAEVAAPGSDPADPVEVALTAAGRLEVRLLEPRGADPAVRAGALGSLRPDEMAAMGRTDALPSALRVRSEGDGRMVFAAVASGLPLELSVQLEGAAWRVASVEPLAPGERRLLELPLERGSQVAGRVLDDTGKGLADVEVNAHARGPFGMPGPLVGRTRSDGEGRFTFPHLGSTARQISASTDGFLAQRANLPEIGEGGRIEQDLVLSRGGSIRGIVRLEDGSPVSGARVSAELPWATMGMAAMDAWRQGSLSTETDDAGHFELAGLLEVQRLTVSASWTPQGSRGDQRLRAHAEADLGSTIEMVLTSSPSISGRVLTSDGTPVAGAQVHASRQTSARWAGMSRTSSASGEDGSFYLSVERAGVYSLSATHEEHAQSETIEVNLPASEPVELRLRTGLSIEGRVFDPSGQPIANAQVERAGGWMERMGETQRIEAVHTDGQGRFRISGLAEGEWSFHARHDNWATSLPDSADLREGAPAPQLRLELRRGARVWGIVRDKQGQPQAGQQVIATELTASDTRMASSDVDGGFEFERLSPGNWQFVVMGDFGATDFDGEDSEAAMMAAFGDMRIEMRQLADGQELELHLGGAPTDPVAVRGRVRSAGGPVESGFVTFLPFGSSISDMVLAPLGTGGSYEANLPKPGRYLVTVALGSGFAAQPETQVEFPVVIPVTDSHVLDLRMPGGAIRGRVTDGRGRPLADQPVTWSRDDGAGFGTFLGGGTGQVRTDADGRYELSFLKPGLYRVGAGGTTFGDIFDEDPEQGRVMRRGVRVMRDQVTENIDLELAAPGFLTGRVLDGNGRPVAGATIFVRGPDGAPTEPFSMLQTGSSGRFRARGLAPGRYTVLARHEGLASQESQAIEVRAAAGAEVELTLAEGAYVLVRVEGAGDWENLEEQGGTLRVEVLDRHGRDHAGLWGMAELTRLFLGGSMPDEERIGPLPPGRYTARVFAPDGRSAERRVDLAAGQERPVRLRLGN